MLVVTVDEAKQDTRDKFNGDTKYSYQTISYITTHNDNKTCVISRAIILYMYGYNSAQILLFYANNFEAYLIVLLVGGERFYYVRTLPWYRYLAIYEDEKELEEGA